MGLTAIAEPAARMSVRHVLRAATASLHARVDTLMSQRLEQPDGYRLFIEAMAAGILPLESALEKARISDLLPDWAQRSRTMALRADLKALALPVPHTTIDLESDDEAYLLGVVYVLEGSRLGSRVILRNLEKARVATGGATGYLSHGDGETSLWQTFLTRLEYSGASYSPARAIAGASAAFQSFLANETIA